MGQRRQLLTTPVSFDIAETFSGSRDQVYVYTCEKMSRRAQAKLTNLDKERSIEQER
jgi:hypothetical protein